MVISFLCVILVVVTFQLKVYFELQQFSYLYDVYKVFDCVHVEHFTIVVTSSIFLK
jgi:hypothetical protein